MYGSLCAASCKGHERPALESRKVYISEANCVSPIEVQPWVQLKLDSERMLTQLPEMIEAYAGEMRSSSLSEMEVAIEQMTHQLGNEMMRQWLEAQDDNYPESVSDFDFDLDNLDGIVF